MSPLVRSLLSQMTLAEMVLCCHSSCYFAAGGVPRLGIVPLNMADGPLGLRPSKRPGLDLPEEQMQATAFPASIAVAASFDPELAKDIGTVMGAEARHWDIQILLAPGVNNFRTPLCGRNFEYFGEDPHLAARIAVGFIRGVQSQGVAACVKHLAGNTHEINRKTVDVHPDDRTLYEIELPPFQAAVQEAGVWTVMGAYNRLRGQWCCQNAWLLNDLLRKDWGFDGLVVSDWNSINSTWEAANNGLDVEMGTPRPFDEFHLARPLREGVEAGIYPRTLVEQKAARFLGLLERLGQLPGQVRPGPGRATCPQHHAVARRAATGSMVLLKNDGILPISSSVSAPRRIAVIGDNATAKHCRSGGSSCLRPPHEITPLEALRQAFPNTEIIFARGYPDSTLVSIPVSMLGATGLAGGLSGWKRQVYAHRSGEGDPLSIDSVQEVNQKTNEKPHPGCTGVEWTEKWTATLTPERSGQHVFVLESGGGFSYVQIDGVRCPKANYSPTPLIVEGQVELIAGKTVTIEVVLHARDPQAQVRLGWREPGAPLVTGNLFQEAIEAAKGADLVLYLGGLCHSQDTEDQDRTGLELPYNQDALITALSQVNPNVVAVLWGGGPMLMPWLPQVRAVLLPWYAGMEGGAALVDVLTGAADPGGRLPCTFPMQLKDSPAHALGDYNGTRIEHREGIFVGYRWADAKNLVPLFPFGHGLSYAQFAWSDMTVRRNQEKSVVSCRITNTSQRFGTEVVQLYIAPPQESRPIASGAWPRPPKELKAFQKISLNAGGSCSVEFVLEQQAFAFWNPDTRDWFVEAGDYQLILASSSRDLRLQANVTIP